MSRPDKMSTPLEFWEIFRVAQHKPILLSFDTRAQATSLRARLNSFRLSLKKGSHPEANSFYKVILKAPTLQDEKWLLEIRPDIPLDPSLLAQLHAQGVTSQAAPPKQTEPTYEKLFSSLSKKYEKPPSSQKEE